MGRLVVTEFMTVDGVMEAPGFDEHRSGRNAWALRLSDDDMQVFNRDQLAAAEALLFGRTTYQIWAAFWPTLKDEASFGRRVNELPKYVVSKSLADADWEHTTILRGDPVEEAAALKARIDGELLVYGSADLVAALMSAELVDEYRIIVFPVVLGSGKRLFRDESDLRYLRLMSRGRSRRRRPPRLRAGDARRPRASTSRRTRGPRSRSSRSTPRMDIDRVLATVLFTDIVNSTGRAAAIGDKAWRQLLDRHDEITRTEVERWHGTAGQVDRRRLPRHVRRADPRAALRLRAPRRARPLRVSTSAPPSTPARSSSGATTSAGSALHIASRALAEAGARQVVVTRTVRELATGTDLEFTSLGTVGLRGVPGEWELFEASEQ